MIRHLYIHFPFCKKICSYCDFSKRVSSMETMRKYKDALIREIVINKELVKNVDTIYFGGGTPSFFPFLEDVLIELSKYIDLSKIVEFTIESTLESVLNLLPFIKRFHINRISIGIESMNEKTVSYIGRRNISFEEAKKIFEKIREEGIENINIDMIHSLPFETVDSIKEGLEKIISLNPTHISYYDLILEEKTVLYHDVMEEKIKLPSEDESCGMMEMVEKRLKESGFEQYEVSNFAKKGYRSIHNSSYWKLEEYIGLGASSHSQYDGKRYGNTDSLMEYLKIDESNYKSLREYYDFDEKSEYFLLGLRMNDGVSLSIFEEKYKMDPIEKYNLKCHIDEGLLMIENDNLKFTEKGMHLGNIVFEEFV